MGKKRKKGKKKKDFALEHYLEILAQAKTQAEGAETASHDSGTGDKVPIYEMRERWAYLRDARLFSVPPGLLQSLLQTAREQMARDARIDDVEQLIVDFGKLRPDEPMTDDMAFAQGLCERLQHPDKMPFPVMFVGVDDYAGWAIADEIDKIAMGISNELGNLGPRAAKLMGEYGCDEVFHYGGKQLEELVGILFYPNHIYLIFFIHALFVQSEDGEYALGKESFVMYFKTMERGQWGCGLSASPWLVSLLIEWINDHITLVEKRQSVYLASGLRSLGGRKHKHIPAPYYKVRLRDNFVEEKWFRERRDPAGKRSECAYRFDRRGSYVLIVDRGPLPLDPRREQQLRKDKRRKIFINTKPDPEISKELLKRGKAPKRPDEWLAVLKFWRRDTVVGGKDKPYIPALRAGGNKQ